MTKHNETPHESLARNLRRLKTEGLDAATEATIELLKDPNTPGQARSALVNSVFRAAGLFGDAGEEDDTPPAEMDGEQLQRAAAKALRDIEARNAAEAADSREEGATRPTRPAAPRQRRKRGGVFG